MVLLSVRKGFSLIPFVESSAQNGNPRTGIFLQNNNVREQMSSFDYDIVNPSIGCEKDSGANIKLRL
jgi:hypothetical protein